ncbi:putative nuclear RNA export factor SDE5 isoform X2 [Salvia splendens]|uniref:putative nuclear RNA export factor SDE5 isoform X2 n=1 Tax=Salvia splendens TaxID=180675 RepID=UPI001C25F044|nr:putative nuclear RNA export factor SDE5 isoform X2 [Salvia splendens]
MTKRPFRLRAIGPRKYLSSFIPMYVVQCLLEAFGSAVSFEDIASSYCETGRNLNSTAEMLCNIQSEAQTTDGGSSSTDKGGIVKLNPDKCSASIGTVSGVIGKDYCNPRRRRSEGSKERFKPVKVNSIDFPAAEIWGEEKEPRVTTQPMDNDLGEFLYRMLGTGFQLDMGVIQQVIGQCGYNMPMCIDKLLDISAATLEKSDDVIGISTTTEMNNIRNVGSTSCPKQSKLLSGSDASGGDLVLPQTKIGRKDVEREILEALFGAPDRFQDHHQSTRPVRTHKQSSYGRIVAKPMEEKIVDDFTFITRQTINCRNSEANEESYDELRKAVAENWVTMKEYYKASMDAFMKKEFESAQNLLEQGDFYKTKAREADEKSAQKLIENSNKEEEYCINVHFLEPKDALSHMRLYLSSLCGLSSIQFMKVVVGTGGDKKDKRRKLLITKLLEEEGIAWTEEENGWTISIRVDQIDHNKLSFINK